MDYLQYLDSSFGREQAQELRFLVSGLDGNVRRLVGGHLAERCRRQRKALFIFDNTANATDYRGGFYGYQVVELLDGGVGLCPDLLDVSSLTNISRLKSVLSDLGMDVGQAMKVVQFLRFVRETETRLGNSGALTAETLEEYGGVPLVSWKLEQLVGSGRLTEANRDYLLQRYLELSAAAADFEMLLVLLAPCMTGTLPNTDQAIHIPLGDFPSDPAMRKLLCKLSAWYIRQHEESCAALLLDDGKGERGHLIDVLACLPPTVSVHLLSDDAFSLDDGALHILMDSFQVRIFTRHSDMASCERIQQSCGQVDVVKRSSSVSIDRRLRASSAWDMLLGTNKTETQTNNAPTREYRFRKEMIHSLCPGTGILDCAGIQTLFTF